MQEKIEKLISGIQNGDFHSLARSITLVENELPGYKELLYELKFSGKAKVIGITGPPGAGKSTLVNALLDYWVSKSYKIAVIAVDPSSPFNYGAILGDRIRMSNFYSNPNVFIRSLASRGALGGLHPKIIEITDVVKQGIFDYILVETVGVGQSEVEIAGLADCTVVTLVPEAGDEIQTIKAGIMEVADIFVLNKADRDMADRMYVNLKSMVHEKAADDWEIPVIKTVATAGQGVEELNEAILQFFSRGERSKQKNIQLLTEKCWHLIQAEKMRHLNKQDIKMQLMQSLKDEDFNLYKFAERYY